MQTSRCAELMVIAVANKLQEVWISRHPALLMTYFAQYMPTLSALLVYFIRSAVYYRSYRLCYFPRICAFGLLC